LRDKACHDIRQTLAIAFTTLMSASWAIRPAPTGDRQGTEAYIKQFEIGQRTLLDLLDTETNTSGTARLRERHHDHAIAMPAPRRGWAPTTRVGCDGRPAPNRPVVSSRPRQPVQSRRSWRQPTSELAHKIEAAPAKLTEPLSLPADVPPETIQQALAGWAAAWSSKDFPRYRGYYAKSYAPEAERPIEQWASERAIRLGQPGAISVGVSELVVDTPSPDKAITQFRQAYTSGSYQDVVPASGMGARGDRWKIQREHC
jgi:hypothetical protein